eukprot:CAMPEP_0206507072 /NCGR_PEP_ID=MMETSP0324_2-20121206/57267_1 /ASSEMBLY_ACC=CAM_ASM_000836 /TAXON_ID=2866 /ORGANISM="Crypthecodinium cohnii, Strain Seligo" /LENGTH=54 /DNA_ID=CAMNT_0053997171 /DNA_START=551 /DNA_END=712 /DNA_ORIENTATION=+
MPDDACMGAAGVTLMDGATRTPGVASIVAACWRAGGAAAPPPGAQCRTSRPDNS